MRISHIINPVCVKKTSDLFIAQPVTFESMRRSKQFAENVGVDVALFYTCYDEDLSIAPEGFLSASMLDRSVLDVKKFEQSRKLPLVKDILDRLYDASDADYFIYTNVDIAVQENFYTEVAKKIELGFDAFVINRRTLVKNYTSVDELPQMYEDKGEEHPGFDCFVFKREKYPDYILGDVCIGANWIGRVLIGNLIVNAKKFKVFDDEYLTFHIGDDRSWKVSEFYDYDSHNQMEVLSVLKEFDNSGSIDKSELLVGFKKQFEDQEKIKCIKENNPFYDFVNVQKRTVDQSPVFVIGFPRSGTTLLQSLIATQNTFTFPETHFFNIVLNTINTENELVLESYDGLIPLIEERYPLSDNAKEYIWLRLTNKSLTVKVLFETLILGGLISQGVNDGDLSKVKWLEKTPSHAFKLDLIKHYYPKATFVYILRDPLHAFSSWRRVSQGWGQDAQPVEEYADLWSKLLRAAEKFKKSHPDNLKFIRLEDLVEDTNAVMADIMDFVGRVFDSSALDNRNKDTSSYILPNESWKMEGATKGVSKDISSPMESHITLFEKIKSEFLLRSHMKDYGYHFKYWNDKSLGMCEPNDNVCGGASKLLAHIGELSSVRFIMNPVTKYRLYKKLLSEYAEYNKHS